MRVETARWIIRSIEPGAGDRWNANEVTRCGQSPSVKQTH